MSVQGNYVILQNGITKALQFKEMHFEDREIPDPVSRLPKTVRALVCTVTAEDGQPVNKILSVLATKLQIQLVQFISDPNLVSKLFTITKSGSGFLTEYSLSVR